MVTTKHEREIPPMTYEPTDSMPAEYREALRLEPNRQSARDSLRRLGQ